LVKDGINASIRLFEKIKKEPELYDFSEKMFTILGDEFIGARNYPEAIAVFDMGIDYFQNHQTVWWDWRSFI